VSMGLFGLVSLLIAGALAQTHSRVERLVHLHRRFYADLVPASGCDLKLWRFFLIPDGPHNAGRPSTVIAASASQALMELQAPPEDYLYSVAPCREPGEYEQAVLAEEERAAKERDPHVKAFYQENARGLQHTLERLREAKESL